MNDTPTIHVWMAQDPETGRVLMQARELDDTNLPRGPRGLGWERRDGDVSLRRWESLLAARLTQAEQDDFHLTTWAENGDHA